MDLVQQLLGAVLFHGLTLPFDTEGIPVHNMGVAGPVSPTRSPRKAPRIVAEIRHKPTLEDAMPNPFRLGIGVVSQPCPSVMRLQ